MTPTEQVIYGVTFAQQFAKLINHAPPRPRGPNETNEGYWSEHRDRCATDAILDAATAVIGLRNIRGRLQSEEVSPLVVKLYLEAIGKETPP